MSHSAQTAAAADVERGLGYEGLGKRIRQRRESTGMSLRELARRIDVSPSLISQVETGKVEPSVATLFSIANELGGSVDELLFGSDASPGRGELRGLGRGWNERSSEEVVELTREDGGRVAPEVQRAQGRQQLELSSGVRWERLASDATWPPGMEFLYVVYEPHGESTPEGRFQQHVGRDWGYIISGVLTVTVDLGDHIGEYRLESGDSMVFDSGHPHRLHNAGDEAVHALWAVLGRAGESTTE